MAKQETKKTRYQNLNNFFGMESGNGFSTSEPEDKEAKIIIKGSSQADIQRKGLELQQKQALKDKFFKQTDHGFQKAMQYEAARLPAYLDFEGMEYYPIIASAMDLMMEEATTIGDDGNMLNVYSDKQRIKEHLDNLFYDIINVNVNLPFWTRNLPIKEDSMIPLLDGTEVTIKEISERLKKNPDEEIWTYSVQDGTKNIVAGKIVWCDLTRKDSEIIKVNLDDETYVETTPDHEFMLRNGTYVQAQNLKENDSLMPFYTRESKEGDNVKGYEKIYNPSSNHHKYTHRLVSLELLKDSIAESKINELIVTHHINFNKKNNHPDNLKRMKTSDHSILHENINKYILQRPDIKKKRLVGIDKYLRSDSRRNRLSEEMKGIYPKYFKEYNNSDLHDAHNNIRSKSMLNHWNNPEYKKSTRKLMQLHISDDAFSILKNEIINLDVFISKGKFCSLLKNNTHFVNQLKGSNTHIKRDIIKSINTTTLEKFIDRQTGLCYLDLIKSLNPKITNTKKYIGAYNISNGKKQKNKVLNHKVVSIEYLNNKHDVYCMEVLGKNGEQDRHNFPVCSKDNDGNHTRNGIFVSNCKYGDNFVYLLGDKKKGITHLQQLVNYEMERIERVENGKPIVKFRNRETGVEFNIFEIAHFRLLGDDKYMPYGSSVLNKVRRVFRQLVMAEDAMLTYRIVRAGEKRVFKIDVGNIDEDDIEEYIQKVSTRFKKQQQVDLHSGQIDYRFNILGNDEDFFIPVRNANVQTGIDTLAGACLALDTKIDVLDGRSLELKDIIREYDDGKKLWSYSINPETGLIVPAPITWAGVTRKNTQVLKLTLDNGETVTCTPDHKFPTKYNGIKEAKDLSIGESMWAFNKKEEKIKGSGGKRNTYEMIYDHSKNDWVFTHRMVANFMKERNLHENFTHKSELINENRGTIHHKDFNRYNNYPNNLCWMNSKDHFYYHHDFAKNMYKSYSEETKENHKILRKKGLDSYWGNISNDELDKKRLTGKQNSLKSRDKAVETFKNNSNRNKIIELRNLSISKTKLKSENSEKQSKIAKLLWKDENYKKSVIEKQTIKYSYKLLDLLIEYTNEYSRVDLILENIINKENSEWLNEFNLLNPNNKQLKKMNTITRNNIDKMLKHFDYKNWRDFKSKIPCYNHKIVGIKWLDEKQDTGTITIDGNEELHDYHNFALSCGIFTKNSNLDQVQDIEYLRDNLFTGLGIPKPFLGFQESAGDGKNMAQMDIRFAKKINRIQQAVIQELNKLAIVHLYLLGFDKDDLTNFSLSLTNPSTQQDILKNEVWTQKLSAYAEATRNEGGVAAMSHTDAKKFFFGWSDRQIIDDFKKQRMERAIAQELQDTPLIIRQTGIFKDVDEKYGDPEAAAMMSGQTGMEGGMDDMGGLGGDMGGMPPALDAPGGGDFSSPADLPPVIGQGKGFKEDGNVIYEEDGKLKMINVKPKMSEDAFNNILENLVIDSTKKKIEDNKLILRENEEQKKSLTQNAEDMITEIDDLLEKGSSFNKKKEINETNLEGFIKDIDVGN